MKLLLDENLPRSLTVKLQADFPGSSHVAHHDLLGASDDQVWQFAKTEGFCIISKDRDFADRAVLFGSSPQVIWLRAGNCTSTDVLSALMEYKQTILDFGVSEFQLLIIPPGIRA